MTTSIALPFSTPNGLSADLVAPPVVPPEGVVPGSVPSSGTQAPSAATPARTAPVAADLAALERQLGDLLGLKVKVANSGSSGTVALHYSSLDQLDMICQRLSGEKI